jgi:hypothetical protein
VGGGIARQHRIRRGYSQNSLQRRTEDLDLLIVR